jgi:hypothetical protein
MQALLQAAAVESAEANLDDAEPIERCDVYSNVK